MFAGCFGVSEVLQVQPMQKVKARVAHDSFMAGLRKSIRDQKAAFRCQDGINEC
jgi:hypothetical protein